MKVKTADDYIQTYCTVLIQLMDQNVIKTLNAHYKKPLLIDIVGQLDADITSILKKCNINDVIVNAAFAWCQSSEVFNYDKILEKCLARKPTHSKKR